jgi:Type I phosphodiesterase / nucleotide pyrophosphatase
MKFIWICLFTLIAFAAKSQKTKSENLILITLDGMRWQEIFGGAQKQIILDHNEVSDSALTCGKFWNDDLVKRRSLLMPFFWTVISTQGQLYGNRNLGSHVNVTNNQWFSYPGYSEILTGIADNERIHSNDKIENPNKNVLEFIGSQPAFIGKVAAYTSWDVFPYIINSKRNGIPVNSGLIEAKGNLTDYEKFLNELMHQVPNPLGETRLDAFTFHYGLEYFKKNRPRVFYFSFDETDDFAHAGKYDLYLESAHEADGFIRELWEYLQSDKMYKDKTTIIVTADHGRGNSDVKAWHNHGPKVEGADQIWLAAMGPDTPAMGEIKDGQLYQNQIAKSMAAILGLRYSNDRPVGDVITSIIK